MLPKESKYIGQFLSELPSSSFPVINFGANTLEHRTIGQPYIHKFIFAPLEAQGKKVIHTDIKNQPGVDLVGDLMDETFRQEIRSLNVQTALCNNILEHVTQPNLLASLIEEVIPPGGYIVVSGPLDYPYHLDPIDNGLRLVPEDLATLFPNCSLEQGCITQERFLPTSHKLRSLPFLVVTFLYCLRLLVPVYKPKWWLSAVKNTRYVFSGYSAAIAILKKN